jgi:hypothetical protein
MIKNIKSRTENRQDVTKYVIDQGDSILAHVSPLSSYPASIDRQPMTVAISHAILLYHDQLK